MSVNPAARRKARHYAMQALYQWQMAGASLNVIEAEFHADNDMNHVDVEYFREVLHSIPSKMSELQQKFTPYLQDRSLQELDPITHALLLIGSYELAERIDVPYKVVINEAVSLGKKFGATDSHKFINGVLDKLAEQLRAVEVKAAGK
ncbi:MAG: transcription antitermination factor NusB [Cellvibrionaceae bacterium]|nr:transcription antitermination factor NusB [Cellvibrionaceae bacterium]